MGKTLDELYQDLDFIVDRIEDNTQVGCSYKYDAIRDDMWLKIGRHSFTIFNVRSRAEQVQKFIEDMTEKYLSLEAILESAGR